MSTNTDDRIESATSFEYKTFLHEPSRPQGPGGNTTALHRHVLSIGGAEYGFFARGALKWAFKGDAVSFDFERVQKDGKTSFNIQPGSFATVDGKGQSVLRGHRIVQARSSNP